VKLAVCTVDITFFVSVIADFSLCLFFCMFSRARCFASNEIINQNCALRTRVGS
jgi:hypothetical protein